MKVPYPIIGADLLAHYGLLPDLRHRRLIDPLTKVIANGHVKAVSFSSISTIHRSSRYTKILADFPEITGVTQIVRKMPGGVYHYIMKSGPLHTNALAA